MNNRTNPPVVRGTMGHQSCPVCGSFGSVTVVEAGGSVVVAVAVVVTVVVEIVVVAEAVFVSYPPVVLREGL